MKYGYWIDQAFCLRMGINGNEGAVYNTLRELPSWAESANVEGKTFFFAARGKLCELLPLVTEKADTMYRHYKKLEAIGLIKTTKVGGKDYVHIVPEFSKLWGTSEHSEKNPKTLGKKSDILVNKNNTKDTPLSPQGEGGSALAEKQTLDTRAAAVLDYFNEHTGRTGAKVVTSQEGISNIKARLREGYSVEDCKAVVKHKHKEWKSDDQMSKHIHPHTLFRKTKFPRYLRESKIQVESEADNYQLTQAWEESYQRWVAAANESTNLNGLKPLTRREYFDWFSMKKYKWLRRYYTRPPQRLISWLAKKEQILSDFEIRQCKSVGELMEKLLITNAKRDQYGPYA